MHMFLVAKSPDADYRTPAQVSDTNAVPSAYWTNAYVKHHVMR